MEVFVEKSSFAGIERSETSEEDQFDHHFSLLKKNVRQTWWLKVLLVLLYFPAIVLLVLSYLQWSGSRSPMPRQQDLYPDIVISESNVLDSWQKTYL